ncbi:MAG TPA: CoA transferase [Candidatus Binatia bacterium]|jgi:crotonobetainyl-CoA:carnitine CoA-transferase CaiB-like acyl-CoA transferase|nr:CoA transferase [Candidatus Binatia bacterium]
MTRALDDVRVLDVTHIYNGPYATLMLALLGAEVIKVEPPHRGDNVRRIFKIRGSEESYPFIMLNSNKKGITLNLKTPRGQALFKELAKQSDVVVENFAVGVMDRLGLGYEVLKQLNPRLIYASSTGFGRSGPYSEYPAYDPIIQAMIGVMSSTGFPGNPPVKAGPPILDIMGGIHLCAGILAALHLRGRTGEGTLVETSLYDAAIGPLISQFSSHLVNGITGRWGNTVPGRIFSPYNCYAAKDGYVLLLVADEVKWQAFCRVIGREDLLDNPLFATNAARVKRVDEVDEIVGAWVAQRERREVMEQLASADITCGIVQEVPEVLQDPHLRARGTLQDITHPTAGTVTVIGSPVRLNGEPPTVDSPSPLLGQHNELVYGKLLGLSTAELSSLKEQGVI